LISYYKIKDLLLSFSSKRKKEKKKDKVKESNKERKRKRENEKLLFFNRFWGVQEGSLFNSQKLSFGWLAFRDLA
jgi:hypothetical protein